MPVTHESLEELKTKLAPELRVLVVVLSDAWGGLEQTAFSDAKALVSSGFTVTLLVKKDSPIDQYSRQSPQQVDIEYYSSPLHRMFDFKLWRHLRALVKGRKINLVHCHQGSLMNTVAPALAGLPKVGLILSRHILNDHNKKDLFHRFLYQRVDYILVLSSTMRHNLLTTYPIPEKKLLIVNLGLDLAIFNNDLTSRQRMRMEWNIPENAYLVGVVGRLDPMKRQDLLIKALARLKEDIGEIRGVLVGAESPGLNGSYISALQKTISDLRMEEYITIPGACKNIPDVMAALDLFVMPSQEEAFGLVALEAMAMKVPVLLSRAGSAEELASGGRGELFRPGDAFDLSRKIKKLYNGRAEHKETVEKAAEYVANKFTSEGRLKKTLEVYLRCARRRSLEWT